jgi:hypothetical protein
MPTYLEDKLNARSWYYLREIEPDVAIDALVRLAAKPTQQQEEQLKAVGYHIRYVTGKVISGSLENIGSLMKVAELPYVKQIETSAPMYQE